MNLNDIYSEYKNNCTKQEQQIMSYIIDNQIEVSECSIKQLARKIKVTISSITKTCNRIGLKGFKGLQSQLIMFNEKNDFSEDYSLNYIHKILKNTMDNILTIDIKNIIEICKEIRENKKIIYIFSSGLSKLITEIFSFSLLEIGYVVKHISNFHDSRLHEINDELCFLVSASGTNTRFKRWGIFLEKHTESKIIYITAGKNCVFKENKIHFYAKNYNMLNVESKSMPIQCAYIVKTILDLFLLNLL